MATEEIVVLATSKKLGGRCIAGISTNSGEWVRPVSDLPTGELRPHHFEIAGRPPEVLDVVRFGYERRLENPAQPENVLIGDEEWELVDRVDAASAYALLSPHVLHGPLLLGDRNRSIAENVAEAGVASSLALVESTHRLEFSVQEYSGSLKTRVTFYLRSNRYDLPLTDFTVGPRLRAAGPGAYKCQDIGIPEDGHHLLTISLGEAFNGQHWKLAAAILLLP